MKIANIYDGVVVKVARNGELVYELSIGILSAHGRQWNWAAKEVAHIEGRDCAEIWLGALQYKDVIAVLVKMLNKEQVIHPDSKGDSYTMDSIPQLLHILHAHGHAFAALLKISQGVFTNHVKCVTVQPSVVMETEAVDAAFLQELKECIGAAQASAQCVGAVIPGHERCGCAKRIGEPIAHGVPIAGRKAHMLTHGLAINRCIGVVMAKRERIS